jgi:hypothetical protein
MDIGKEGDHTNRLIERRLGDYPHTFGVRLSGNDTKAVALYELAINEL